MRRFGSTIAAVLMIAGGLIASAAAAHADVPHAVPVCATPKPGEMGCDALRWVNGGANANTITPFTTPNGFGASDLESAYNLPTSQGFGRTVAIAVAQDDPNAESDLATYRSQYGLPQCSTANGCFMKRDQSGGTTYPTSDTDWAAVISLTLDMVSAACPNCHMLLVEATSPNTSDLLASVNEAVTLGANVVTMPWGGPEDSSDTTNDAMFLNHPGVALVAAGGDSGYQSGAPLWPSSSPGVISVGGTSLVKNAASPRGWSESVWSTNSTEGTTSGCSAFSMKPTWQTDSLCAKRTTNDIAAVADPATGVASYDTFGASGWSQFGGTDTATPLIAGAFALAAAPKPADNPAKYLYNDPADLNDVTTGSTGRCPTKPGLCHAEIGYDGPTGLGTPNGVAALGPTNGHITLSPASKSSPAGKGVKYKVTQFDDMNKSLGDQTANATFSISPEGSCTANVCTPLQVGPHTVRASLNGLHANAALNVTPGKLTITTTSFPDAQVGSPFQAVVFAAFGVPPYTFSGPTTGLPDGFSVDAVGNVTGTPDTPGRIKLTITVTDSAMPKPHKKNGHITVQVDPLSINVTPDSLPDGAVGKSYSQTLSATGGTAPYTFFLKAGGLPRGLKLSSGGKISGKPTTGGSFFINVLASDKYGFTGAQGYTIDVSS
jgi:hypothetical protein